MILFNAAIAYLLGGADAAAIAIILTYVLYVVYSFIVYFWENY